MLNVQLGETRLSTLVQDIGHKATTAAPSSAGIHARRVVDRRVSRVTLRPTLQNDPASASWRPNGSKCSVQPFFGSFTLNGPPTRGETSSSAVVTQ